MKRFEITEDLANKVLKYLGTRPYVEVFQIVNEFQNIPTVKEEPKLEAVSPMKEEVL